MLGLTLTAVLLGALDWSAPDACPNSDFLEAQFHRLSGGEVPLPNARVRVSSTAGQFSVSIDVDGDRTRTLEGPDCQKLIEATALVLSLEAASVRPLPVTTPVTRPTHGHLSASAGVLSGVLGVAAPRLELGAELDLGALRVGLTLSTGTEQPHLGFMGLAAGATVGLPVTGGLEACFRFVDAPLVAHGCAGAMVGVFSARGVGLSRIEGGVAAWVAGRGSLIVGVPMTDWLVLRTELSLLINIVRPRAVTGEHLLFQPEPLGGSLVVGAAVRLW